MLAGSLLLSAEGLSASEKVVVPIAYRNVAKNYGIPYRILFAIGMQESQRVLSDGRVLPWPWTLNFAGRGRYYESSTEMEAALMEALDNGITNIDIGIMQINAKWHRAKSFSLIDLMRPEDNLNIAAQILRREHDWCGGTDLDWMCAVGSYHSRDDVRAEQYVNQVMKWYAKVQ